MELAGVFQSLGTDTTLLVRRDTPLRSFDSLLVETLMSEMDKSGLTLKPHATTKVNEHLVVEFSDVVADDTLTVRIGRLYAGVATKDACPKCIRPSLDVLLYHGYGFL